MRISAIATLCTAPLALAGSLDMDLRNRDGLVLPRHGHSSSKGESFKDFSGGNNNNEISSITQTTETEVILIWVNEGADATTTTVNSVAASTAAVATATHTVVVGGTEKVFTPNQITANVGDMVVFEFAEQNHTATTSAFGTPCTNNNVFDTGFMPNINGTVNPPPHVGMLVNVSTPVWFYCRQKTPESHCGLGMTFAINPTVTKTFLEFQQAAIAQEGTGATSGIVSGSSSSSSSTSSTSSDTSSSSGSGLTTGQGTLDSTGACTCAVLCAPGSIPNPASQGINGFGGMNSNIPAANLAT
jgi:plastocyanin